MQTYSETDSLLKLKKKILTNEYFGKPEYPLELDEFLIFQEKPVTKVEMTQMFAKN